MRTKQNQKLTKNQVISVDAEREIIKATKRRVNSIWIICILSFVTLSLLAVIIVCVLGISPVSNPETYQELTATLSVVSVVTSIMLSIFAIFYSFINGESTSNKIDSLNKHLYEQRASANLISGTDYKTRNNAELKDFYNNVSK